MRILIIAEHSHQKLSPSTYHTISAGLQMSDQVEMILLGSNSNAAAEEAASITSVAKIHHGDHKNFEHPIAEKLAPPIHAWLRENKDLTHILMPATSFGKNLMPRIAALAGFEQISDVSAIESPNICKRPIYAGNAIATVETKAPLKFLTIRTTTFERAKTSEQRAEIVPLADSILHAETAASKAVTFKKQMLSSSERPELTSAARIVSGGRGLQSKENFKLIEKLADKLGAAVGASRAAVDANFVPNDYQVGQTGKVVAPDLYIAIGISGAIQHLAGIKDSKIIVAINKDEDAPIFQVADFGLVADLFEAVPEMIEKLG